MKLAVIGSRTFRDYAWLEQCLLESFDLDEITGIVSGGARGADALAVRFAAEHGLPLEVVHADWARHGRKAGPLRNTEIIRRADGVAAFWDGRSPGTKDSVLKALAMNRPVRLYACSPSAPPPAMPSAREGRPAGRRSGESRMLSLFPEER